MHKLTLTLATAAACTLGASLTAQAGTLGGAHGIRAALDQISVVEPVHCIPGRVHRRSPPYDGCYRSVRRYYAPRAYGYAPRAYRYAPYYGGYGYGYGRHYYGGPRIGIGIGFGGHRHGGLGLGFGFGW
jgi:hypothetical protein